MGLMIYKYVGAGNDFLILPDFEGRIPDAQLPWLAKTLCNRPAELGADGMMLLRPSAQAHCRMLFFNSDGSTAEMCGNGARCLCRFCHDRLGAGPQQRIESPAGPVTGERLDEAQYRIELNRPTVLQLERDYSYVELGNPGIPHVVLEADLEQDRDRLREFARRLRHDPAFPKGANVNLYTQTEENALRLLTFERGVEDFTLACGTGTGATVAALYLRGMLSGKGTQVQCRGGLLEVDILPEHPYPRIFLTGPAQALWEAPLPRELCSQWEASPAEEERSSL